MITISGFWLGVLMTIVVEIMLVILMAIIRVALGKDDRDEVEIREVNIPPEIKDALIREIKKYEEEQNGKNN